MPTKQKNAFLMYSGNQLSSICGYNQKNIIVVPFCFLWGKKD